MFSLTIKVITDTDLTFILLERSVLPSNTNKDTDLINF